MYSYDSDTEIISGLIKSDPQAYSIIFNRFVRPLLYFVEGITGNTQVSQDIVTESFIKVFGRSADFQSLSKLKSFLFTAANRAALDFLKTEKRHNAYFNNVVGPGTSFPDNIENRMIEAEVIQSVYSEIEKLPPQVREVVRLSLIEGKSIPEVATQMGIAYKTVQNHKTKGLNLLRVNLLKNPLLSGHLLLAFHCLFANTH